MAICPTPNCGETLLTHSRRFYCAKCRHHMGRWSKRRASEIIQYTKKLTRNVFRLEHVGERKIDQVQAAARHPVSRAVRRQ